MSRFPTPARIVFHLSKSPINDTRTASRRLARPSALDPTRPYRRLPLRSLATYAKLAESLEESGNSPKGVADFLTRCLFCMFAEDVGLLRQRQSSETSRTRSTRPRSIRHARLGAFQRDELRTRAKTFRSFLRKKHSGFTAGLSPTRESSPSTAPARLAPQAAHCECATWSLPFSARSRTGTLYHRARSTWRALYAARLCRAPRHPHVIEPLRADWNTAPRRSRALATAAI